MSADEERFFLRLMLLVDDFGRFDARPSVIRGRAFALKPDVSDADIVAWLTRLAELDVVTVYEVRGKRFVWFVNWDAYQNRRAKDSKWPAPEEGVVLSPDQIVSNGSHMIADAITRKQTRAPAVLCSQPPADVPVVVVVSRVSETEASLESLRPAVADSHVDPFGPLPTLTTDATTTDRPTATPATIPSNATTPDVATTTARTPRQPKLTLTGEAPSSRKPANPEHAEMQADLGRWLDRYRVWRNDPKATVQFHVFAQAWKARGIDDLLLALDGLKGDDFAKTCAPKALLSEAMIAKGVGIARNGKPRATNPYEANLESARALYRQAQANGDWIPPEN